MTKTASTKSSASFKSSDKEFAQFSKEMKQEAERQKQEGVKQKEKDRRLRRNVTMACVAISFLMVVLFGWLITTYEFAEIMRDLKDVSIYIMILALIIALSVRS